MTTRVTAWPDVPEVYVGSRQRRPGDAKELLPRCAALVALTQWAEWRHKSGYHAQRAMSC